VGKYVIAVKNPETGVFELGVEAEDLGRAINYYTISVTLHGTKGTKLVRIVPIEHRVLVRVTDIVDEKYDEITLCLKGE
jgi:hypothetical protein